MKNIVLIICCVFALVINTKAQDMGRIYDTVYYDNNSNIVFLKSNSSYFRLPAVKDSTGYIATYYNRDGSLRKIGHYKAVLHNYKLSIEDGVGIEDGLSTVYNDSGRYFQRGMMDSNTRVGVWQVYNNNSFVADMRYLPGEENPVYTYYYKDHLTKKYEGQILFAKKVTDLRSGLASPYTKIVRWREQDVWFRQGMWRFFDSATNNMIKMVNYYQGELEGMSAEYDKVTKKKAKLGYFIKDKRDGLWLTFDENNGNVVVAENYKGGKLHGDYKKFDAITGKLTHLASYQDGRRNGIWRVYNADSTFLLEEGSFVNGNGSIKCFDTTGILVCEKTFRNDLLHGTYVLYRPLTGKKMLTQTFHDGLAQGNTEIYNGAGQIVCSQTYDSSMLQHRTFVLLEEQGIKVANHYIDNKLKAQTFYNSQGQIARELNYRDKVVLADSCISSESALCSKKFKEATCVEDFWRYINESMEHPDDLPGGKSDNNVQVGFLVNEDGSISNIDLIKKLSYKADNEALRLIQKMPKWTAESIDDKSYPTYHVISIPFYVSN